MPGNDTQLIAYQLVFLPSFWQRKNLVAGQVTPVPMDLLGMAATGIPLPRKASLVTASIMLSEPVTAQFARIVLTRNGVETSYQADILPAHGTHRVIEIPPGKLVGQKGDIIGLNWGSHPGLLPAGTIEMNVFLEVQF